MPVALGGFGCPYCAYDLATLPADIDAGGCRADVPFWAPPPLVAANILSASGGSENPLPSCNVIRSVPGLRGAGGGASLTSEEATTY